MCLSSNQSVVYCIAFEPSIQLKVLAVDGFSTLMAHAMDHKITSVAIIGAGISGVTTAAHLLKLGLDVVVFERADIAGGVWHFDSNATPDPQYPAIRPSKGDQDPLLEVYPEEVCQSDSSLSRVELAHSPPGPCYAGLMNNVSTRLMRTTLLPWPSGIGDFVNHTYLEEYIQDISKATGVHSCTCYRTRVEEVRKIGSPWQVTTISLVKRSHKEQPFLQQREWTFDAVVAASGHYNAPRVPDIPGLAEWKAAWPKRIQHSKGYRSPEVFKDKTVLLVGAGVSSTDIAREIAPEAKMVYQSSRGGALDLPAAMLPPQASRVSGILSFEAITGVSKSVHASSSIPGRVILQDGTSLDHIDYMIICTGYMVSYPYLRQYHSDLTPASSASNDVLVTSEGEMVHNCYKDTFYIPDPTLAFVGTPYHIATFSLFEFQAILVARVFAGLAQLPAAEQMRAEYEEKVVRKGVGRGFHSLRGVGEEQKFVAELVAWMNRDAERLGLGGALQGHTAEWHGANREREEKLAWLRAVKLSVAG
jgi:ACS family pantothenate transporter-like MFS transporter